MVQGLSIISRMHSEVLTISLLKHSGSNKKKKKEREGKEILKQRRIKESCGLVFYIKWQISREKSI